MHILNSISLLALSMCAYAQHIQVNPAAHVVAARQASVTSTAATTTATLNASKVSSQLAALLSANPISQQYTTIDATLGISVPSSLRMEIITAVPGSILVELMDPVAKASMASEFHAGNTPAWYSSLPPDVKSWFEQFAVELSTGSPVFTVTATTTSADVAPTDAENPVLATTSSKAQAREVGADWNVVASAVAFAGALGAGLAL